MEAEADCQAAAQEGYAERPKYGDVVTQVGKQEIEDTLNSCDRHSRTGDNDGLYPSRRLHHESIALEDPVLDRDKFPFRTARNDPLWIYLLHVRFHPDEPVRGHVRSCSLAR